MTPVKSKHQGSMYSATVRRMDQLIGVQDVGDLLKVSRQRADQLTRQKGFPDAVTELAGIKLPTVPRLWLLSEVQAFARATNRL
jgi:hypothetical protein